MKQEYITIISKRIKKKIRTADISLYHQIRIPQPDSSDRRGYTTDHNAYL